MVYKTIADMDVEISKDGNKVSIWQEEEVVIMTKTELKEIVTFVEE